MSSFSFICAFLVVMVCNCYADLCHDFGRIKFENDTKLECINGTWTAKACMADHDEQMADGEIKAQEPYLLQCQKMFSDVMKLVVIGCSMKGRILAPSQTYETENAYYKCVHPLDGKIELQLAGCVVSSKRVPLDNLVQLDGTVYKCTQNEKGAYLEVVGCAHGDHTVKLGEKFIGQDYWYVCEANPQSAPTLTVIGCINDLTPLKEGEVFYKKDIIYECAKGKDGIQAKGVGCLEMTVTQTFIEHAVGDSWSEIDGAYECKDTGRTVSKVRA